MFSRDLDFDRRFQLVNQLWRGFDRAFQELEPRGAAGPELTDDGERFVYSADLPGVSLEDVEVKLAGDVLTIAVKAAPPKLEGWSVHRRERQVVSSTRSWVLPVKVDAAATTARLTDGVLTVTVPKSPEEKPRTITVQAS